MPNLEAVLFDLGNTLIHEQVDDRCSLDQLDLQAVPHAENVLRALESHYRLALVTDTESSSEVSVRKALKRLHLESFFSAIVTSVDLGVRKPDPRMFFEALRRIDVAPQRAVMVGNDPQCDVLGARRVGMKTILVTAYSDYRKSPLTADHCVKTLNELPLLIASIDNNMAQLGTIND